LGFQTSSVSSLPFKSRANSAPFDLQGHRGGRGETNENSLPSFAWGMIDGVTSLELDNNISKDGEVLVWHDMFIPPDKCLDTAPVFEGDPEFPYVGKFIANLTLAQIKTLDCGTERQIDFPMQLVHPGTKMSTLGEVFAFTRCVDPERRIHFNIESKIDPVNTNTTFGVNDFVTKQHAAFLASGYSLDAITYQSFDWRTLIGMKALDPRIATSALVSSTTIPAPGTISPWLAGLNVTSFAGTTIDVQIVNAANSIKANILSPMDVSGLSPVLDPTQPGFIPFTTKAMIDQAHSVGMTVKPWTVDRLNVADQLLDWGADGLITDYPTQMRRRLEQRGFTVAPTFSQDKVLACLAAHT